MRHTTHWIGGKPWTGTAERQGDIHDPTTGQVTGHVDFATADVAGAAVAAAREAFPAWRDSSLAKRAKRSKCRRPSCSKSRCFSASW